METTIIKRPRGRPALSDDLKKFDPVEYHKVYFQLNKEKLNEQQRQRRAKNREKNKLAILEKKINDLKQKLTLENKNIIQ